MGFGTLAAGRGPEILRCLAQDLDGLARVDAGEHHDVGGDHLDGGGRGDRRWYCPGLLAPATDQMTAMLSQVRT